MRQNIDLKKIQKITIKLEKIQKIFHYFVAENDCLKCTREVLVNSGLYLSLSRGVFRILSNIFDGTLNTTVKIISC